MDCIHSKRSSSSGEGGESALQKLAHGILLFVVLHVEHQRTMHPLSTSFETWATLAAFKFPVESTRFMLPVIKSVFPDLGAMVILFSRMVLCNFILNSFRIAMVQGNGEN